jgi:hypothetical protein
MCTIPNNMVLERLDGNVLIRLGCRREVEGFKGIRRLAVGSQQCGRRWDWTGISTYEVVDSSGRGEMAD